MMTGLSNEQIVSLLGNHSFWARRACREILDRKDEFAPLLLKILDKAVSERDPDTWDFYDLLCPASLLLAQMRVTDAYPRLISLLSYEEDDLEYVWGDWLFEVVPFMLRDTYNGNPELLKALIENRSISPWARMMGVSVFGRHYYDGHISREEIVTYLRRLANEVYCGKTTHDDKLILTEIGSCARDQQLPELIDDVKALYARDDIDKSVYGDLASYLEDFDDPVDRDAERHADAIGDLETWRWFEKKEEKNNDNDDKDDESYDDDAIGRNDPCPCGSGKKYKHCHGRR